MGKSTTENERIVPKAKGKPGKKPGSPKTGGRKPGVKNKNSANIRIAFDEAGLNICEEYVRLYLLLPEEQKLPELKAMMKYFFPTFTQVEALPEPKQEIKSLSSDSANKILKAI